MKKLLVITGESGGGKTTLIETLVENYSDRFKRVVTYTSRPMRLGEKDGLDYNFLSNEKFEANQGLILKNKTTEGFYYGTNEEDLLPSTHHLLLSLRPRGIQKLIDKGYNNILIVQITISDELKVERMRKRGDSDQMILDRLRVDIENRAGIDFGEVPSIDVHATEPIDKIIAQIRRRIDD